MKRIDKPTDRGLGEHDCSARAEYDPLRTFIAGGLGGLLISIPLVSFGFSAYFDDEPLDETLVTSSIDAYAAYYDIPVEYVVDEQVAYDGCLADTSYDPFRSDGGNGGTLYVNNNNISLNSSEEKSSIYFRFENNKLIPDTIIDAIKLRLASKGNC